MRIGIPKLIGFAIEFKFDYGPDRYQEWYVEAETMPVLAAPTSLGEHLAPQQIVLLRRGLKLRQLHLLVALEDTGKLHDAAASLRLSQPAASRMLAEIERIVGTQLFERHSRGLLANHYGEAMIRRARTMLAELAQADREITALRSGEGGIVGVGAVMAPAAEVLVDAVATVRERLPRLQISVRVETSDALIEALLASQLDFIIARIPRTVDPSPFSYREHGPEAAYLVARNQHPLARRAEVLPHDLDGCDWVLQPRGSLLRHSVEAMLRRHGVRAPERVVSTPSVLMMIMLLTRTDMIAALSAPVADLLMVEGQLRRLALRESITVEPFGLITVKDRPLSPAVRIVHAEVERRLFLASRLVEE